MSIYRGEWGGGFVSMFGNVFLKLLETTSVPSGLLHQSDGTSLAQPAFLKTR